MVDELKWNAALGEIWQVLKCEGVRLIIIIILFAYMLHPFIPLKLVVDLDGEQHQ